MRKLLLSLLTIISMLALLSFTACVPFDDDFTVTWVNEDGTVLEVDEGVKAGAIPTYDGETPTKAATAQYAYTFAGWDVTPAEVTADVTYTATYTSSVATYTVTWANEDGTVLETDEGVEYGAVPTYDGETPTKPATAQYSYAFAGWDVTPAEVTGNVTYTATFEAAAVTYTVAWLDADGTELNVDTVEYEGTVAAPADPSKTPDANYIYTFAGWDANDDGEVDTVNTTVTANATYKAVYTTVANPYGYMRAIVTTATNSTGLVFDDENGTVSATASADNMYIYFDGEAILSYGEGKNFVKFTVSSPTGASLKVVPMTEENKAVDGNWNAFTYDTVYGERAYYLPLNDTSFMDFANYDLRFYIGYGTQQLIINSIEFIDEIPMVSSVKNGSADGNTFTATSNNMEVYINHFYVQNYGRGKDYAALTIKSTTMAELYIGTNNGTSYNYGWGNYNILYVHTTLGGSTTYYFALNDKSVHDWQNDLLLMIGWATQNLVVESLEFITSEEIPMISSVQNGSYADGVYTATADHMYVSISSLYVTANAGDNDYLRLTVSGPGGLSFGIFTKSASANDYTQMLYETVYSSKIYLIPLKDSTVHDFSKYDLKLYAGYGTQKLVIENVEFVTEEAKAVSKVVKGACNGNVYTATAANMEVYISHEYVQEAGAGKKYVAITVKSTTMAEFRICTNNGTTQNYGWGNYDITYVWTTLGGSTTYYIALDDTSTHDWQYDLMLMIGGAEQNLVIESIEFVDSIPEEA